MDDTQDTRMKNSFIKYYKLDILSFMLQSSMPCLPVVTFCVTDIPSSVERNQRRIFSQHYLWLLYQDSRSTKITKLIFLEYIQESGNSLNFCIPIDNATYIILYSKTFIAIFLKPDVSNEILLSSKCTQFQII